MAHIAHTPEWIGDVVARIERAHKISIAIEAAVHGYDKTSAEDREGLLFLIHDHQDDLEQIGSALGKIMKQQTIA